MIERRNPYGPIDQQVLERFEDKLPARLPADFRQFLIDFNGARFVALPSADLRGPEWELRSLFGLHSGPTGSRLDSMRPNFLPFLGEALLVIGDDDSGNYFALGLTGEERGSVSYVDHEMLGDRTTPLPIVARSFGELLNLAGRELMPRQACRTVAEAIAACDLDAVQRMLASNNVPAGCLFDAISEGDLRIVQALLDAGANPNERGGIGDSETPLFLAARWDRADIAKLLLARGADPNVQCAQGGTAAEMATSDETLSVFLSAGAHPTTPRLQREFNRLGESH